MLFHDRMQIWFEYDIQALLHISWFSGRLTFPTRRMLWRTYVRATRHNRADCYPPAKEKWEVILHNGVQWENSRLGLCLELTPGAISLLIKLCIMGLVATCRQDGERSFIRLPWLGKTASKWAGFTADEFVNHGSPTPWPFSIDKTTGTEEQKDRNHMGSPHVRCTCSCRPTSPPLRDTVAVVVKICFLSFSPHISFLFSTKRMMSFFSICSY
jgi:hypothetical protein